MEQICYNYEIVLELLRGENHARGIAKKLNVNHMKVFRMMKELEKLNVVDYKSIGKNKAYFLKNTVESKNYVFMAELYKTNKTIKKYPILRAIIEGIQRDKRIKLALLFGSYAKFIAKETSDIDVYIETMNKTIKKELSLINSKLSIKIGDYDKQNLLIKEIEKNHVVIKGVEDYYERNKFFE